MVQDVGMWLTQNGLGHYKEAFLCGGVDGAYLNTISTFTSEQILEFIFLVGMSTEEFLTMCYALRQIKSKQIISQYLNMIF